jgi:hypothetical protein
MENFSPRQETKEMGNRGNRGNKGAHVILITNVMSISKCQVASSYRGIPYLSETAMAHLAR